METVHTARFDTPFGSMLVASTEVGLAYLELPHASGRGFAGWVACRARGAQVAEAYAPNRLAVAQILEYLEGKRREFELPLDLRGTPFQLEVYEQLRRIPYGETRSYAELAQAVKRPKAVRAVGTANGSNPVSLVVPCHRVIATGGKLGGYGGGLQLKAQLLAMERSRAPAGALL